MLEVSSTFFTVAAPGRPRDSPKPAGGTAAGPAPFARNAPAAAVSVTGGGDAMPTLDSLPLDPAAILGLVLGLALFLY